MFKHRAKLVVSLDKLIRLLRLPEGTEIRAVRDDSQGDLCGIELTIEHPDLPKTYSGCALMRVKARHFVNPLGEVEFSEWQY